MHMLCVNGSIEDCYIENSKIKRTIATEPLHNGFGNELVMQENVHDLEDVDCTMQASAECTLH